MESLTKQPAWPHATDLREVRGPLSVEKAAAKVGVSRQTWVAWEGGREPQYDNLRAIVEAFDCPPTKVGYEAPAGWELVPSEWIAQRADRLEAKLDALIQFHKTGDRNHLA